MNYKVGDKVELRSGRICTIKDITYWENSNDIYGYIVDINGEKNVIFWDDIERIVD